jgi:hypothetical protein
MPHAACSAIKRPAGAVVAAAVAVMAAAAVAAAVACGLVPTAAGASLFRSAPHASATISAPTLSPPSNPGIVLAGCTALSPNIQVTWSVTPSTWADGYQVGQSLLSGGPYTWTAVAGRATTSFVSSGLLSATTYYFVVRATKAGWTSVSTAEVNLLTGVC